MPNPLSTDVQWIVIRHMVDGYSVRESARMVYISTRTVERLRAVFQKYGNVVSPFQVPSGVAVALCDELIVVIQLLKISYICSI